MFKLFRAISTIWRIPILWSNIQADRVFKILKGLHERGFHKRLHVFFEEDWDKEEFQQITSSPALEYLYAVNLNFECDLVYQANLKKLAVHSDPGSSSLHILFRFLDSSTIQRTKYFVKLSHLIWMFRMRASIMLCHSFWRPVLNYYLTDIINNRLDIQQKNREFIVISHIRICL